MHVKAENSNKRLAIIVLSAALFCGTLYGAAALEPPSASGVTGGLVVHLGCGDGQRTVQLRANEKYLVHGLDADAGQVAQARKYLLSKQLSGEVSVAVFDGKQLPYVDNLVNLLVAEKAYEIPAAEMFRALAPNGVARVAAVGGPQARSLAFKDAGFEIRREDNWLVCRKPVPAEIDEWTHYLHGPDNNAVSRDRLVAPPKHMQFRTDLEWTRNHHKLASVSGVVTAQGRFFYVMDSGPGAKMEVPANWSVVARDAYNGVFLWRRDIGSWTYHLRGFRSGPAQLPRLLVTDGARVYVPLALTEPLSALDAVSGKTVRTYAGTEGTEEIVLSNGVLLVVTGSPAPSQAQNLLDFKAPTSKKLLAFKADDGKLLWSKEALSPNEFTVATLGADDARAYYQYGAAVVCLDLKTGSEVWSKNPAEASAAGAEKPKNARANPSQGKKGKKQESTKDAAWKVTVGPSTLVVKDGVVLLSSGKNFSALAAADGALLWQTGGTPGFRAPQDVFVINGVIWLGNKFTEGLDLKTGEVKAKANLAAIQTAGHHHRCYRNKATERYIIASHRGIEYMDLEGDDHSRNNWVRGLCQYGVMPANGLTYAPPHSCGCYMEAKLYGFWALSAKSANWKLNPGNPLEKGPAFGAIKNEKLEIKNEWPTYMGDARRSGVATTELAKAPAKQWSVRLGSHLTAPVVAGGLALVADVDTHTVHAVDATDGGRKWSFTTGGRIDSPPTIHNGTALFGSHDGWVYCLRLTDGALVWRFRAAPADRNSIDRDQVESLWPVYGSVLAQNGLIYFCAGRNSYIDDGLFLYALNPATGAVVHRRNLATETPEIYGEEKIAELKQKNPGEKISQNTTDYRTFASPDLSDSFSMAGNMNDIVTGDGERVFLRHLAYEKDWQSAEEKYPHLFSTSKFTDGNENHRSHMTIGLGFFGRTVYAYPWIPSRFGPKMNYPIGLMFVYEGNTAWGIQRGGDYVYTLYQKNIPTLRASDPEYKNDLIRTGGDWAWSVKPQVRPRSILRAGERIFLGGMPLSGKDDEAFDAFEGRKGGLIAVFSTTDGSSAGEIRLDSPVVWNGLAAAGGRLYASTADGSLVCLK